MVKFPNLLKCPNCITQFALAFPFVLIFSKVFFCQMLQNIGKYTAQNMKFFFRDFFSKRDQICKKVRIFSHLFKRSLKVHSSTGKALINDRLRVSRVPWKFRIPTIYNFAVLYPWNLLFSEKVAYFLTVSIFFSIYEQNFKGQ